MAILKLPDVGNEATLKIAKCEVVEGQSGEQVKFTTDTNDLLFLPRTSADRQLLRLGFGEGEGDTATVFYGDVDGATLHFYRTPNEKKGFKPYWNIDLATGAAPDEKKGFKPYWNIDLATGAAPDAPKKADRPKDAPPSTSGAPSVHNGIPRRDAIEVAYKRAWMVATKVQGEVGTADSIQAGAATLLIAYTNQNLLGTFEVKAEEPKPEPAKKPEPRRHRSDPVPPPTDDDDPQFEEDQDDLPF